MEVQKYFGRGMKRKNFTSRCNTLPQLALYYPEYLSQLALCYPEYLSQLVQQEVKEGKLSL